MSRKTAPIQAPRSDLPDLPPTFEPAATLERSAFYDGVEFSHVQATDGPYASLRECRFVATDTDELTLAHATLSDVEFSELRVASLRMRGAGLTRVRFVGGRIGTLDLSDANLDAVVLEGVRIDYLSLGRATVTDMDVRGCRIDTIDLPSAQLTRVRFTDSESTELDPRETRNTHVDLRGLTFSHVTDLASLRGAVITEQQAEVAAVALAEAVGIRVLG